MKQDKISEVKLLVEREREELLEKIYKLMAEGVMVRDPVRCATMGQAGRELAESAFDVRQVVAVHLQIYQELMDKS